MFDFLCRGVGWTLLAGVCAEAEKPELGNIPRGGGGGRGRGGSERSWSWLASRRVRCASVQPPGITSI